MSSDNVKENASVADSTVTEWKNGRGNLDEPVSPSFRVNDDTSRSRAEEDTVSCPQIGVSGAIEKGKPYDIRYFVIKSLNHENIQVSVDKGIWATQAMNEDILDEAFHNSNKVILIFSVNMSGYFQGYAQMTSPVGLRRDQVWSQGNGGRTTWGRSFDVNWLRLSDLPFQRTLHLKNPWNQYKPVKISRDCQELPPDIGEALCELLDGQDALDVNLKMDIFARNDLSSERPYVEPSLHLGYEDSNASLIPNGSMFYPSLLYQHQVNASRLQLAPQRINGVFSAEESAIASGQSKSRQSRHSQRNESLANLHVDTDVSPRTNMWGLSAERSPLASNLTEDDILEMTYEEYLEAHSRGSKRSHHPVSGPSRSTQRSLGSEENCDDSQSGCSSKKRRSH
ncbi:YTH domain-containing protein 1 [Capsicum annuum]|uniref:YTH domain-containing protein 1 n=1 Tax=Capsicum annuum TaxID=4072 RepID=UPI0007BEE240|nr:YTH domain-containing protein 1 [Capsicum annuum]XP_047258347.1 YTH domain-containing protein 1 [Capsicum annuum]